MPKTKYKYWLIMKQTLNFVLLFNVKQSLCYNLSVFVPNTDDILYICVIKMTVLSLIKHNHKTQEWLIWKKPFNTGMVQAEFYTAPLHQLLIIIIHEPIAVKILVSSVPQLWTLFQNSAAEFVFTQEMREILCTYSNAFLSCYFAWTLPVDLPDLQPSDILILAIF